MWKHCWGRPLSRSTPAEASPERGEEGAAQKALPAEDVRRLTGRGTDAGRHRAGGNPLQAAAARRPNCCGAGPPVRTRTPHLG
jgi:hypothetical protein